jgi:pimeloyl-ACP methyl ester carboxylesterase
VKATEKIHFNLPIACILVVVGQVHLVAHDWGGVLGWGVAGLHPSLVKSLVIMNAPHPSVFRTLLTSGEDGRK